MAVFKCKMCGGAMDISTGDTVITCEYCGTQQTLPKLTDERREQLYDRANHFRRNNEFDKAMGLYEQILNEDATDSEAYWSILLCRYGIEYVEDPATHKRVPTVNRAQFTSIFDDNNYKSALEHADPYQRAVYEAEARAINEIQKGILAISQKEEPFDVFICYKESDNSGRRTPDSVLANDLYHQLTQEGFKVFFSRITLEDKLGTAYEPYIFAALNSSKVMVVLGTKKEYFNAVWVKNEWSRYLSMIKAGQQKMLIPAYKDMDPYDLPEEFSHLQAQDMTKLGFMQDLIRGIKKIIGADTPAPTVIKETVVTPANANIAPLLERAFMFLEDGKWDSATEYCEKVLDSDPKCADAYLGELMAQLKVGKREALRNCPRPFDGMDAYKKAMRFGDDTLQKELQGYIDFINERNLNAAYTEALTLMQMSNSEDDFRAAAKKFAAIRDFKDAEEKVKECNATAEEKRKDKILEKAKGLIKNNTVGGLKSAIELLKTIPNWRDTDEQIKICEEKLEEFAAQEKAREEAMRKEEEARKEALKESMRKEAELKRKREEQIKKIAKLAIIISSIALVIGIVLYIVFGVIIPAAKYNEANELMEAGKTAEAIRLYAESGNNDSSKALTEYFTNLPPIVAGDIHTVGLKSDGTVVATGWNYSGQCDVSSWTDIVAVAAGDDHTVGLKKDGTVVATGDNDNGQCNVSSWTDIVAVAAGLSHTVGLKSDGTVVAIGSSYYGQCNVSSWTDIVAVASGSVHTVGLKKDGTVVATGDNYRGKCNVSSWTDIVAVSAGVDHTVGLKSDGTVVAVGENDHGRCDVSDWTDIVAVAAGDNHTVGLKRDGTVVAVGHSFYGQCNVSSWTDIVAVSAGDDYTVGLKSDGTVVANGWNEYGQCDVSDWNLLQ